jgi:hypothetical protein
LRADLEYTQVDAGADGGVPAISSAEIHAPASSRWRDPDARLLKGAACAAVKDSVLTDLGLHLRHHRRRRQDPRGQREGDR